MIVEFRSNLTKSVFFKEFSGQNLKKLRILKDILAHIILIFNHTVLIFRAEIKRTFSSVISEFCSNLAKTDFLKEFCSQKSKKLRIFKVILVHIILISNRTVLIFRTETKRTFLVVIVEFSSNLTKVDFFKEFSSQKLKKLKILKEILAHIILICNHTVLIFCTETKRTFYIVIVEFNSNLTKADFFKELSSQKSKKLRIIKVILRHIILILIRPVLIFRAETKRIFYNVISEFSPNLTKPHFFREVSAQKSRKLRILK